MKIKLLSLLSAMSITLAASPALAAETGSNPEYPEGNTLGVPTGALPPPGVYVTLKPTYSQGRSTNSTGGFTGAHSVVSGYTGALGYIPGWKFLGANVGFFIRAAGVINVSVTTPPRAGSKTFNRVGLIDTEFVPISLSWPLGHHLFAAGELGFYIPNGQYSPTAAVVTGENHWTIEPDASLSYLPPGYQFTVHGTLDKNFQNQAQHYINGTTVDFDFTAMKSFGRFAAGPVGYFYKQITRDEGPAKLNGGSPEAVAVGGDMSYIAKDYRVNVAITHDVYDRNVSDTAKAIVSIVIPLA
ncbi:MAG: transporter [Acidocella sp.]|nr:transporter [Acidocella sp.]